MSEQTIRQTAILICAVMISFMLAMAWVILTYPRPLTLEQQMDKLGEIRQGLDEVGSDLNRMARE